MQVTIVHGLHDTSFSVTQAIQLTVQMVDAMHLVEIAVIVQPALVVGSAV